MPKRSDLKKIMVIGSGPIVIGQAAEFDYAGTQACLALKEEGYEVVLVNSNPATIMTDSHIADKVYMEPLELEYVAKIIRKERPDAIVPGLGGQTGLNLVVQLAKKGILEECGVEVLGTSFQSIEVAEDRQMFKDMCIKIGEPVLKSYTATTIEEVVLYAKEIGYPIIIRPAFTLGGSGGGFADNEEEIIELAKHALKLSPVHQVLVEKSIKGFKEIEYEVMRDANDTAIVICNMENIDPVGVHTGDSMVVAPTQTLTSKECAMLRNSALKIIKELKIAGGCNVQFALDPYSMDYYLIEVNPRVSRSSALASKATGYPIARVTAKIAVGLHLDEIKISSTVASYEPTIDYVVSKIARFPFDKFTSASRKLSTQMKATGEVMGIGRTIEESLLKSIRSLETNTCHIYLEECSEMSEQQLLDAINIPTDLRIYQISELLRRGISSIKINDITKIDLLFIDKLKNIVDFELVVKNNISNPEVLLEAKKMGFSDEYIGILWNQDLYEIYNFRKDYKITPVYKIIDSCAAEYSTYVPYFYSSYVGDNDSIVTEKPSIIVLGSGPIRIGQGVEFDYSTVHAIWAIKQSGYEAIIINNNPETVSTDYTTSDKLYFEPLNIEDVMNIVDLEKPLGVIVTLGGQTAINLAEGLDKLGVKIIGTGVKGINNAEDRQDFERIMNELKIPQPLGKAVFKVDEGQVVANQIGYPVLVRPSYVLGGRAMKIVNDDTALRSYLTMAVKINKNHPVLIDKYIIGQEVEVDAICDGEEVFIPGIMEHIEKTGVHSGDSMSVYPTYSITEEVRNTIINYTNLLGLGIGIIGLFNIQFIVDKENHVYVIEVNPRSSRTVPFISKVTGVEVANIATKVMLGSKLRELGYVGVKENKKRWYVKAPTFSFSKLGGVDTTLSPEMKSTGEAIGYDDDLNRALYKALRASGLKVSNYGTVFVTIANQDKDRALEIIRRFYRLGFNIEATSGTAQFLKKNGIKTRVKRKISDGSQEILDSLRKGHVTYVINTTSMSEDEAHDGFLIRRTAVENDVAIFTSLDTVNVLLNVLEDITIGVSCINE